VEGCFNLRPPHREDQTRWLKVQNSDQWPQNAKQIQCGVCSEKDKPGEDLNVEIAMQNCVLAPASGCFTPNCNSEINTSQGKAYYIIVSTIFQYVWIPLNTCILFHMKRLMGYGFYERRKG